MDDRHLRVYVPEQGEGSIATVFGSQLEAVTQAINLLTVQGWSLIGPVQLHTRRDMNFEHWFTATLEKKSNLNEVEHPVDKPAYRRRLPTATPIS